MWAKRGGILRQANQGISSQEWTNKMGSFHVRKSLNSSLGKCFILEQTITTNDRDHRLDYSLFSITEVNQNMEYGVYWGQNGMCWVLGKHCQTEQEWRELIKPFMEE
jgi:hypothetical protein